MSCSGGLGGNGERRELSFEEARVGVAGAPHHITLEDGHLRQSCGFHTGGGFLPDLSPEYSCGTSPDEPITRVIAASCSEGCAAATSTTSTFTVLAERPGQVRVSVQAETESGDVREDSFVVDLHALDRLDVVCSDETCPGRYGVFAGAAWGYRVTPVVVIDGGDQPADVEPAIESDLEAHAGDGVARVLARAPGPHRLAIHAPGRSYERDVVVAEPREVMAIEVREWRGTLEEPVGPGGPETPGALAVVSKLADGTELIGGPALVEVFGQGAIADAFELRSQRAGEPGWWAFQLASYTTTATLSVSLARLVRSYPLELEGD